MTIMTFMECIGKLSATIEDSDMYNFIILGDFNLAVDTPFESELLEFCSAYELTISDYQRYGPGSGQFTYVSDAHNSTSWLDHIICSHNVHSRVGVKYCRPSTQVHQVPQIYTKYKYWSSTHFFKST